MSDMCATGSPLGLVNTARLAGYFVGSRAERSVATSGSPRLLQAEQRVRSAPITMICAEDCGLVMSQPDPAEVFVRGVWTLIPDAADASWVDRLAAQAGDDGPLGDYGPLVRRFLDAGITTQEIARFARIVGYELAFGLCHHLDDPVASYEHSADQNAIDWALSEVDPLSEEVVGPILGTHELLLTADPTGNEMRPPAG